jgi:ornithine cyclodeaminase
VKTYNQQQIIAAMNLPLATSLIAQGFIAYAQGKVKVPPVQNFLFSAANGDCCVKSAWIEGEETFTVKISTGFYDNPAKGLASNDGLMLVFSAVTGEPIALLKDGGWLTSIRTALAGQIVATALAPSEVTGIGIVGTGQQAQMQLEQLMPVTTCRKLTVWGRSIESLSEYSIFAQALGFDVTTTNDARQVAVNSNLIVTTTPSRQALIASEWIKPGTHITAVGADGLGKQELDINLVARADVIVADSLPQCSQYGEISHALNAGLITKSEILVLGNVLSGDCIGRQNDQQITIADLTGVAVQDAQVARCAMKLCEAH